MEDTKPTQKAIYLQTKTPLIQRYLDCFFISSQLQESVVSIDIIPAICTEHSALYLKSNDRAATDHRGPSCWKFNNSLLRDGEFVLAMQQEIIKIKTNQEAKLADPRMRWGYMKHSIRKFCQNYSKKAAKERSRQIKELESKLNRLSALLADNPCNETLNNLESAKAELNNHYSYVTEGIIVRSRVQWYDKGEKNDRYFLNLEIRNKIRSSVHKLIVNDIAVLNLAENRHFIKGQLQRFDKLSLFDRFRHIENGFDINFWKFSCYKPSKFWNGSSDDFSEKGQENMHSGTSESTRVDCDVT